MSTFGTKECKTLVQWHNNPPPYFPGTRYLSTELAMSQAVHRKAAKYPIGEIMTEQKVFLPFKSTGKMRSSDLWASLLFSKWVNAQYWNRQHFFIAAIQRVFWTCICRITQFTLLYFLWISSYLNSYYNKCDYTNWITHKFNEYPCRLGASGNRD